jgi:hypothetical protein
MIYVAIFGYNDTNLPQVRPQMWTKNSNQGFLSANGVFDLKQAE